MNMESGSGKAFQKEFTEFRKNIKEGKYDNKADVIMSFVEKYPRLLKFRSGLVEIDKAQENFNIISLFSVAGITQEEAYEIINRVLAKYSDSLDDITLKWILPQLDLDFEDAKKIWKNHKGAIKKILKCEDLKELKETLANLRDSLSRIKGGDRSAAVW